LVTGYADGYRDIAARVAGTPEPVVVVAARRFGQTVARAEEIDSSGFAVVAGDDRDLGGLLEGERVEDAGDGGDLILPTEAIGERLR
jgi:hypothetical protein